jgi:HAD superfamily hydrolase (TIGR01509 family)
LISTILWDNDGVLVDTEGLYFEATRAVLESVGAPLSTELFKKLSLEEGRSVFDLARDRGLDEEEVEQLRNTRNERYSELLRKGPRLFRNAPEVLSRLRHIRMGIVTSSRKEHFDLIHASTGLLEFIDFVLTRQDYERAKPHPDPYLAALERYGLRDDECIVVEDSVRGLRSAREAGIRCIVVPNELTRGGDFDGAHAVVSDLAQAQVEILRLIGP